MSLDGRTENWGSINSSSSVPLTLLVLGQVSEPLWTQFYLIKQEHSYLPSMAMVRVNCVECSKWSARQTAILLVFVQWMIKNTIQHQN